MDTQQRPQPTRRLALLLAAILAVLAAVLPLTSAAGQAPAAKSILNVPFRGVSTPGATFDLAQSVVDFNAGANAAPFTTDTPHYLSVLGGSLTVDSHGHSEVLEAGKGVAVPAGSTVNISNPGTASSRLFVTTLLAVGTMSSVHESTGTGVAVFATARRTMSNAPALIDVIQMSATYDVGYRTPDHVMNEFHLMVHLAGQIGYHYLDGFAEQYGPRSQATMHEGRPGWMGNDGSETSAMAWTWLGTPGKPLTSPVPAPAAAPAATPAPPITGTGLRDAGPSGGDLLALAGSGAIVVGGLALGLGKLAGASRAAGRRGR